MSSGRFAEGYRYESSLRIEELPAGAISKVFVEVVDDALGQPIRVPVLVARGCKSGPVFGITAALHGNELNGIPVIHRLFDRLDPDRIRGTIVAVVVLNTPGLLLHQRELNDGTDLNHIMPGRGDGNVAEVYAHRIVDRVVRCFDFLVDLHTASFGRVNSLYVRADMTHPVAAKMAYLYRPEIIVHKQASDSTLRGTAQELGIPAITAEIGNPQRFQRDYIKKSVQGLRTILTELKLLPKRKAANLGPSPLLCQSSYWLYTDRGGLLDVFPAVTESFESGQVIARLTDVFGQVLREYRAAEAGVTIGKSANPVGQTGARILHVGVPVEPGSRAFYSRDAQG